MRISDWSSDVCSSDLIIDWAYVFSGGSAERHVYARAGLELAKVLMRWVVPPAVIAWLLWRGAETASLWAGGAYALYLVWFVLSWPARWSHRRALREAYRKAQERLGLLTMLYMPVRSEEHQSELQSLMRISYAVFC